MVVHASFLPYQVVNSAEPKLDIVFRVGVGNIIEVKKIVDNLSLGLTNAVYQL